MFEIFIAVLAGILFGLSFSLVAFPLFNDRQIKKEKLQANVALYHEILLKRQNRAFTYSPAVRKAINLVHACLLTQNQEQLTAQSAEFASKTRYEPSL